jgi:hypothetical protein
MDPLFYLLSCEDRRRCKKKDCDQVRNALKMNNIAIPSNYAIEACPILRKTWEEEGESKGRPLPALIMCGRIIGVSITLH